MCVLPLLDYPAPRKLIPYIYTTIKNTFNPYTVNVDNMASSYQC